MLAPCKKSYEKPRQHIKKQRHHFIDKGPYTQRYGFFSSHVQMWELDHKKAEREIIDTFKLWCLEKTLESPFDSKEIKPVHPKGNQSWIFIGRTDTEAEAPILCFLMLRTDSLEKTLMLGKIEGKRRRETKDKMVEWYHQLNGHESEQTPGDSEGQGSLACCSSWDYKESDTT